MDYQKAYLILFNAITTAIHTIEKSFLVTLDMTDGLDHLREAQQQTEEMYTMYTEGFNKAQRGTVSQHTQGEKNERLSP